MMDTILNLISGFSLGVGVTLMFVKSRLKNPNYETHIALPSLPDFPKRKEGRVVRNLDEKTYELENRRDS